MRTLSPMCVAFVVSLLLATSSAFAQQRDRAVVTQDAPIMLLPDSARQPLRVAASGTILAAFDEKAGWLRVEFQDPQFGRRAGYIETRFVRIERGNLQPLDLSVDDPAPSAQAPGRPSSIGPPDAPPTILVEDRRPPGRVFIDVNAMSFHPHQGDQTFTFTRTINNQTATFTAGYPALVSVRGLDLVGEIALGSRIGVGVRYMRAWWSGFSGLTINVPHPTLSLRFAADSDYSDAIFRREEDIFDFPVSYSTNAENWRVVIFGGPTYFRLKFDNMVSAVVYTQFSSPLGANTVNITGERVADARGSTFGVNAGVDAAWFFTKYVGLGGGVRINTGKLTLDPEPISGAKGELTVGATKFVGGARFRF